MDARDMTRRLGGEWRNGRGQAACPLCQPERRRDQRALSLTEHGGKTLLYCFKNGCSFADITAAVGVELSGSTVDHQTLRQQKQQSQDYAALQRRKADALWQSSVPIAGTVAETYLRRRAITADLPASLRFLPSAFHAPTEANRPAMLAQVEPTLGVHRTFLDADGRKLPGKSKMMLGPCSGGAVRLSQAPGPLVVCEGIETGLSLLSGLITRTATVWACLSTSGMKALQLPDRPGDLIIASDGDVPGQEATQVLANRAHALGWSVSLMPAPEGQDWNDVLQLQEATV